jgi:hypothetical protein
VLANGTPCRVLQIGVIISLTGLTSSAIGSPASTNSPSRLWNTSTPASGVGAQRRGQRLRRQL